MEVILLQDVEHLGDKNTVVKVRDGYGRNYLIPRGLAVVANDGNRSMVQELQRQTEKKEKKLLDSLNEVTDKLKNNVLRVGAKVGQSDKIFGSITNVQIADAIKKQFGLEIDRKKIAMPEEVKTLGTYEAVIALQKDHNIPVTFEVVEE